MNCPPPKQLQQLLDDMLPTDQEPMIRAHLESCADCQKTLEKLAAGAVTWEKTAQILGEQPARDGTALINAVEKLHDTPTSAIQTQAGSVSHSSDEDLSFLQPSQKPNSLGRLDEYEILSVIGKGGFGIVLKAFDESLHRIVAIKVMLPHLASNATARDRFIREAKTAAAVMHENVVTIHVVEKKAKIPYLVMQFVSGVTLNEKIDKGGPLGLKEILRIGMQIAEGLAAAANLGLVHRDIKPANILLENGAERVKITDFGLARTTDDASVSQLGTVAGTPMYMSPEQANGEQVDHRSDLFSLGSVLYVMSTGRPPFRATSTMAVMRRVCDETATPVQRVNPDIPVWLADVIAKLHAKKPDERFQSAKEVAEILGKHLAQIQQPTVTTPASETLIITAAPDPAAQSDAVRSVFRQMLPWLGASGLVIGMLVVCLVVYSLLKPAGQTALQIDADPGSVLKTPALDNEFGVLDYAEIHDADEKCFDAWIAQMKKDGYRPVSLSVQTVKEAPRYTSIAIKEEAKKAWEFARVRSDDAKHIEDMRNKDYVAIAQCVYREKSYLHQAYVWVLDKNASMDWPSLGSKEDIDKKIAEAHKRKARLVYRSAFQGAAIVYDIIVGGPTSVSWADSVDLSLQDCKTWIEKQKAQGWRPEHLYAYGAGPNTLFGAITIQDPKGPDWDVSWALTPEQYDTELAARRGRGFRPHTAVGHDDDSGALRFSVIWIRYSDPAAKAAPMPP